MEGREESLIEIDGSYGEGGGQILRTSLALSTIFHKPVSVHHIRAKRNNPGLRPQHLRGVEALARISGAKIQGATIGSTNVTFLPQDLIPGEYQFDVGNGRRSAGAVTLLLQTILPALCLGERRSCLRLTGGTHVPWSPPFHYLSDVLFPVLGSMGLSVKGTLERWGWYPKGGGRIEVDIDPTAELKPMAWVDRGPLKRIRGISATSNLPKHVAERQGGYARKKIRDELDIDAEIDLLHNVPGEGPGSFFFLAAESEKMISGFSSLGAPGKRAEAVAEEAVGSLTDYLKSDACVDAHLADQLLVFMALARGRSSLTTERITNHLLTNIWVVRQFMNLNISVSGTLGRKGRVDVGEA